MRTVAVLFARRDSIYKTMEACDVWDEDRNALKWPGGAPIVSHAPCGHWGRLATFCTKDLAEKEYAIWSIDMIRSYGGVFEHPITSRLFSKGALKYPLPARGDRDKWGGYVITIAQWWFGHRAEKWTKIYVCGCDPANLPEIPIRLGDAPCVIQTRVKRGESGYRPHVSKPEREHTPKALAEWLVEVARRTQPPTISP